MKLLLHRTTRWFRIQVTFDPRNMWIGAYWTIRDGLFREHLHINVCLLPTLPILIIIPLGDLPNSLPMGCKCG